MSGAVDVGVTLGSQFARELPELAVAWQAEASLEPRLLVLNEPLAAELGWSPAFLRSGDGVRLLTGTLVPDAAAPVAQAYAGHQFGGYSPVLGDGRALLLGEVVDTAGGLRDIHLKGSGRTPFARGGDGLAVLGPMLREYLVSEAMHALGVPTTRALAVTATGRAVRRQTMLPGAVLTRVASSHLRVGSFQYAAATRDVDLLRRLTAHAIARHYPLLAPADNPAQRLLDAVIAAQGRLVAQWMLAGFVHGVMNTDNMTISGETIDYGPCAFMDAFDPGAVYSSIDTGGRYAFGNQPLAAEWNLARFAEALLPLLHDEPAAAVERAQQSLGAFREHYSAAWSAGMRAKLGLGDALSDTVVGPLIEELIALMQASRVDYTSFFRALGTAATGDGGQVRGLFLELAAFDAWAQRWQALEPNPRTMDAVNPVYIPRNHLVEEALDAATAGNMEPFERLLHAVTEPYRERPGLERYAAPAPASFGAYRTYCGT